MDTKRGTTSSLHYRAKTIPRGHSIVPPFHTSYTGIENGEEKKKRATDGEAEQ
jgi:hypothetical protein